MKSHQDIFNINDDQISSATIPELIEYILTRPIMAIVLAMDSLKRRVETLQKTTHDNESKLELLHLQNKLRKLEDASKTNIFVQNASLEEIEQYLQLPAITTSFVKSIRTHILYSLSDKQKNNISLIEKITQALDEIDAAHEEIQPSPKKYNDQIHGFASMGRKHFEDAEIDVMKNHVFNDFSFYERLPLMLVNKKFFAAINDIKITEKYLFFRDSHIINLHCLFNPENNRFFSFSYKSLMEFLFGLYSRKDSKELASSHDNSFRNGLLQANIPYKFSVGFFMWGIVMIVLGYNELMNESMEKENNDLKIGVPSILGGIFAMVGGACFTGKRLYDFSYRAPRAKQQALTFFDFVMAHENNGAQLSSGDVCISFANNIAKSSSGIKAKKT